MKPRRRGWRVRRLRLAVVLVILAILGSGAAALGMVMAVGSKLPQLDPARQTALPRDGVILARDGQTVLAVLRGDQARIIVPSDKISPLMKQAIVAVEDRRFFEHRGIDLRGIGRALWDDIVAGRAVQGGSTITQQLVKN